MANSKQSSSKRIKMAERAQQLMNVHFPNFHPSFLWHRKTHDGFSTVPRTLPNVMQAVDAQSKGQPAGHTLFCLWSRAPDHPVIAIENPATFAAEAGFFGERAVDTWRKRMKCLRDLVLIQTKPGPSGDFHYVLLINPNAAMELMRSKGLVQDGLYSRFIERLADIGAYGDIEAVHAFWAEQKAAAKAEADAAAAAAAKAASESPPPSQPAEAEAVAS